MPEIITGQDGSLTYETGAAAEEASKVEAARAELVDEATGQSSDGEGLLLGKYRTPEDLAEAYKSLQAEYTRLKSGQQPAQQQQAEEQPEAEEQEGEAPEQTSKSNLTAEAAEAIQRQVLEQTGGQDGYKRLANWAASNLPADRVNAYNEALMKGDQTQIMSVLKGLQYDYMMANGYEPKLTGGRAPSNEVRGYTSEAQVIEAMNDPRYSGSNPDPSYIREVERRLAVSNVFQAR